MRGCKIVYLHPICKDVFFSPQACDHVEEAGMLLWAGRDLGFQLAIISGPT